MKLFKQQSMAKVVNPYKRKTFRQNLVSIILWSTQKQAKGLSKTNEDMGHFESITKICL